LPTLSFDGETHDELVRKVRRWLASAEGQPGHLEPADVVVRGADLTKDALALVAAAAPAPIAHNEIVKGLAQLGYDMTDQTREAVLSALATASELSGEKLVKRIEGAGRSVTFQMGKAVARQVLKAFAS
jgi:hypothetical protein